MPDAHVPPAPATAPGRPAALRALLVRPGLDFLMEAHNGLSAKIAEEAGFAGIWASGLTISAALGLRDSNEASWTQVLDVLEYMADSTHLPILVDGDTGYGNFNNVRRLVRKLCQRGIAGVCIEDKLFPKTNSFLGEAQPLADVAEFCGRLRAAKDAQTEAQFSLVARVEALISGWSMDEALRRAEAYHAAGADAVLIHSKKADAGEITGFMRRWDGRCPVVIVPTMYHATPTQVFRRAGVSVAIWANHLLRASITAMEQTARRIAQDEALHEVEGRIASVNDVFRLTANQELEDAQRRYLPESAPARAVVLAAGKGALGDDGPVAMLDIRGQPLLRRLSDTLRACGVAEVTVVRGWRAEAVALPGVRTVDNPRWADTGEAASLSCAADRLRGESVVVYGDVLFRRHILDGMRAADADLVIAVDASIGIGTRKPNPRDLVRASRPYAPEDLDDAPALLEGIGGVGAGEAHGEWIGLLRATARGSAILREELAAMAAEGALDGADMPALLARLAARAPVAVHWVAGHWLDVDTMRDLADARNFG